MSTTLNRVEIIGQITKVDVKEFKTGMKIMRIDIPTKNSYKKDGEWKEDVEWHKIVASIPNLIERLEGYQISKGDYVRVEGQIRSHEFTAKDGSIVKEKQITCTNLLRLKKATNSYKEKGAELAANNIEEEDIF